MVNDEQEETYQAILELYDLAEALVHTVESPYVDDQEQHLALIEPLVEQLTDAADILAEEYTALVKRKEPIDDARKMKMETALGRIFAVIEQCKKHG